MINIWVFIQKNRKSLKYLKLGLGIAALEGLGRIVT